MNRICRFGALVTLAVLLFSLGCAGRAWDSALREDTPGGYYRFMRDHPKSDKVESAQERLDYHRVKRNLTLANFREFEAKYPNSELLDVLRPDLEPKAFEAARAGGTGAAYRAFMADFPNGAYAKRALGNAVFLEAAGYGGDPRKLEAFAIQHPTSDFAAEAERSIEAAQAHANTQIRKVALSIRISKDSPEPKRIAGLYIDAARKTYDGTGIDLLIVPPGKRATGVPTLTIEHREVPVATSVDGSDVSRPGVVAQTRITLRGVDAEAPPVFQREFELRVDSQEKVDGRSILFGESAPYYWSQFFVPVAAWNSNLAVRNPVAIAEDVVAVDAAGDRSVLLYEHGSFDLVELSDPEKPVVLAHYERPEDFKRYSDVQIVGDRIVIFGEDGLEIVGFTEDGPKALVSRDRADIGSVLALTPLGDGWVVATSTGLVHLPSDRDQPEKLMRRVVHGVDVVGGDLVFTDGETVFVSTPEMIRAKRVKSQLKLGKHFGPGRVRAAGDRAVIIGNDGVVVLDLRTSGTPKVLAKVHQHRIGRVVDATNVGHRIFLVGERGLLVMDPSGRTVLESVDVVPRTRVATMGRHIVAVGDGRMQVVDATPYLGFGRTRPARSQR